MTDPLPKRYRDMVAAGVSEAAARQRWADFLGGKLLGQAGLPPGNPGGPPIRPGVGGNPPAPGAPSPGAPGPPVGGGMPPPPPGEGPIGPIPPLPDMYGNAPQPYSFEDPFNVFLSMAPVMNMNTEKRIGDAMASAGFSGNRYGTSAMNTAGQLGAENAMQQNALLSQLMYDATQAAENRGLQAAGQAIGLGGLQDQIAQDRVKLPFGIGAWEQGRQDNLARFPYEDFERNKMGWLPFLSDAFKSQGAGSPGQIYTTQEPGSPGAADWLGLLAQFFG